jgi:hypothetical protein
MHANCEDKYRFALRLFFHIGQRYDAHRLRCVFSLQACRVAIAIPLLQRAPYLATVAPGQPAPAKLAIFTLTVLPLPRYSMESKLLAAMAMPRPCRSNTRSAENSR